VSENAGLVIFGVAALLVLLGLTWIGVRDYGPFRRGDDHESYVVHRHRLPPFDQGVVLAPDSSLPCYTLLLWSDGTITWEPE